MSTHGLLAGRGAQGLPRIQGVLRLQKTPPLEISSRWSLILVVPKGNDLLGVAKKFDPSNVNLPRGVSNREDLRPIDAAFRILREQTNVKAIEARLIDMSPNQEDWRTTYVYLVTTFEGNPLSTTHGRALWTSTSPFLMQTSDDFAWAERLFKKLKRIL